MSVISPEFKTARFIGNDPTNGILAAVQTSGATGVIVKYDPVAGDVTIQSPGGSSGTPTNTLKLANNVAVTGTLSSTGAASLASIATTGAVAVGSSLTVATTATTHGTIVLNQSATVGAYLTLDNSSNASGKKYQIISTASADPGGAGALLFYDVTDGNVTLATASASAWTFRGNVLAQADNASDVGASGANRFRNLYLAGSIVTGGGISAGSFSGASAIITGTSNAISLTTASAGAATYYVFDNTVNAGGKRWRLGYSGGGGGSVSSFDFYNQTDSVMAATLSSAGALSVAAITVGTGGAGTSQPQFIMNGGSGVNGGPLFVLQRNSVTIGYIGNTGSIVGGASSNIAIYSALNGIDFYTGSGTLAATISSSGHFLAGADNAYDIGASGANRPRNLYIAGSATVGGTVTITASAVATLSAPQTGTNAIYHYLSNTGGDLYVGVDNSAGTRWLGSGGNAYAASFVQTNAKPFQFIVNGALVATLTATGSFATTQVVVGGTNQFGSQLAARTAGNNLEFGHGNTAGYGSALGALPAGQSFIAFQASIGTTSGTYKTTGIAGFVMQSDLTGGVVFGTVPTLSADNQPLTTLLTLTTASLRLSAGLALRLGNAFVAGAPTATGYVTIQDSTGTTYKALVGT